MSWTMLLGSAFLIGLSGAMMPGPVLTYVVNGSLRKGFIAGPLIITGHALLELLLVVLLLSGLSNLFASELFTSLVGVIGGGFLLFMALGMVKSVVKKEVSLEEEMEEKSGGATGLILPGALISISNPYWILWWATVGITYLANSYQQGLLGTGVFFMGHIAADFAWYSLIAFVVSRGRKFINDRAYRGLIIFFGLVLMYFSGVFILDGIQYFI
ncbi:MAG: LysE family transporter [Halanaerobiaceae bacterium]